MLQQDPMWDFDLANYVQCFCSLDLERDLTEVSKKLRTFALYLPLESYSLLLRAE